MNTTIEQRKEKALEIMKQLDIFKPYRDGFKNNNDVCYFERYAGFWAWQDKELAEKIKEIEEKYNSTVYAITHELLEFGECYSFLLVTYYKEEWNELVTDCKDRNFFTFAYVWNKDDDYCSEFGTIAIKSFGGGIRRIA